MGPKGIRFFKLNYISYRENRLLPIPVIIYVFVIIASFRPRYILPISFLDYQSYHLIRWYWIEILNFYFLGLSIFFLLIFMHTKTNWWLLGFCRQKSNLSNFRWNLNSKIYMIGGIPSLILVELDKVIKVHHLSDAVFREAEKETGFKSYCWL